MESAQSLFSKIMQRSLLSFNTIFTFRQTARAAMSDAAPTLRRIERSYAEMIFKTPTADRYFTDKDKVLELVGGFDAYVAASAQRRASEFTSMIEGASLIYAHSLLDAIAYDLCIVASISSPSSWRTFLEKKKVNFKDIQSKSAQEIETEAVSSHVAAIERESLIKKIETLHAVCKPPKNFSPVDDYTFDAARLKVLDQQRHDIVHGLLPLTTSVSVSEIEFLRKTALYLAALVSNAFDVKADPKQMLQIKDRP